MNELACEALGEFTKTTNRVITRRGVLWLGQTCNIRCHFCYFLDRIKAGDHPEHPFMSLEKAKHICYNLRHYYNNEAIDIQGGEPLLFRGIYDLVRFCRDIELYPTLITNGILLANMETCIRLKESGVRDLLISVHALRDVYDFIVGTRGASAKQMEGINHCIELGIPFRFNVVLSKWALPQYVEIARLAIETGARVVNFIAFNPFEDQASGKRTSDNVATYSEVAVELDKALDVLEEAHVEANVRYIPLCIVQERHLKSMYNFQQLSYDLHEWDYASWSWTGQQEQRMRDGDCSPLISLDKATHWPLEDLPYAYDMGISGHLVQLKRFVYERLAPYPRIRMAAVRLYHGVADYRSEKEPTLKSQAAGAFFPDPDLYRSNAILRAQVHCKYVYSKKCSECSARSICDGFHGDYVSIFGAEEARPMKNVPQINDPCYFIARQEKVVEKEDYDWVLGEIRGRGGETGN